jgi:hypothetical protein
VDPPQVPDFIALRGDPSDKIPGAKGVGPVAAANLLRKYRTLEQALLSGRFPVQAEELRLYRKIAAMDASAPLPSLRSQKPTWSEGAKLAREWQLNRLADRLAQLSAWPCSPRSPGQATRCSRRAQLCGREAGSRISSASTFRGSRDEEGLRPEALPQAAAGCRVAAILCSPALRNPTNASMSLARRREVLRIADQLGALIIEDDSSGHLSGDETPTMASLERQRCIYVCGTSKSIAPGLRIGLWPGERR